MVGGVVAFPVTLMIIATVLVFGPWWGGLYALAGAELSAVAVFVAGLFAVRRWLGRKRDGRGESGRTAGETR